MATPIYCYFQILSQECIVIFNSFPTNTPLQYKDLISRTNLTTSDNRAFELVTVAEPPKLNWFKYTNYHLNG